MIPSTGREAFLRRLGGSLTAAGVTLLEYRNKTGSDAELIAIISHGGPALNKSAEMPPWGYTLSKSDIAALVSYIRAVADPPYEAGGVVYAQR